jgi:succinylarginine dihydrolase
LFNSQLISIPGEKGACLIAPSECAEISDVKQYLDNLLATRSEISQVNYFDLKQSMRNGGGPACLRLRIVMSEAQITNTQARVFLDEDLNEELKAWINQYYRESLSFKDLADPMLLEESRTALDQLTQILQLGSIYEFQHGSWN